VPVDDGLVSRAQLADRLLGGRKGESVGRHQASRS
jgi:hypothetical protein